MQTLQELDPSDFFSKFETTITVSEPVDKQDTPEQPKVRSNLSIIFERMYRQDQMQKHKEGLDKLSSSKSSLPVGDKENRNPNIPNTDCRDSLLKHTPKTFLRQKNDSRKLFGEKDKSLFKKIEARLSNGRINKVYNTVGQERSLCMNQNHSNLSNVQALKRLIKQSSNRNDISINTKKEQLYSSIFGGKPSGSGGLNRSKSNAFDIPKLDHEYSKYGLQNNKNVISRKKSRIRVLHERQPTDSSLSHSRIEKPWNMFRSKELSHQGIKFTSQSDLHRPNQSKNNDVSLNYFKQKCFNAVGKLNSNRPPSSKVIINIGQKSGSSLDRNQSTAAAIETNERRVDSIANSSNVYKHFKNLLAQRSAIGGVQLS